MDISKLDKLLKEEEGRVEAARQLGEIARHYPELFERAAKALLGGPNGVLANTIKRVAAKVSTAQIVLAYLEERGESSANQVAKDVTPRVTTKCDPPQKIVYSTLASLERTHKITARVEDGTKLYRVKKRSE